VSDPNGAVAVVSRDDDENGDDDNIDEEHEREVRDVDVTMIDVDSAGEGGEEE